MKKLTLTEEEQELVYQYTLATQPVTMGVGQPDECSKEDLIKALEVSAKIIPFFSLEKLVANARGHSKK